jgi:molybdopterin molybdotransferase
MMDGYAVALADAGRTIGVAGEVAAGQEAPGPVGEGRCYEIMTGAPCPPGAEAVVPREQVRRDGERVSLPGRIDPGQHIAPQGSECPRGTTVLEPGETISPLAVAVMASFGRESVQVIPRPRLAVITTGTELTAPGATPSAAQIRDSNGPMLVVMARDMGLDPPSHQHSDDRLESLLDALAQSADADVVLLTGGVSVGNYDLVPEALEHFGAKTIFHRVRQKPGKPLLLARKSQQLIFGLPGNPLASHFCFHRYVAAAIRQMEGKPSGLQALQGELTESVDRKTVRTHFVAASAEHAGSETGGWRIRPLRGVSSADIFAACPANCYAEVPPGTAPAGAGDLLSFTWIGNAPWPN